MNKKNNTSILTTFLISLLFGITMTFYTTDFTPNTMVSYSLVFFICSLLLLFLVNRAGLNKQGSTSVLVSFVIRIIVGGLLFYLLPKIGYANDAHQAGYIFADAFHRDMQAWQLANSNASLISAFGVSFSSDQYGGLLALSAGIYRLFSPGVHLPVLVVVFAAMVYSAGIPFLWKVVHHRWGEKSANIAIWAYALFPETVLLGSSQMREPFLIGLSAIAFWCVANANLRKKSSIALLILSIAGLFVISSSVATLICGFLLIWYLIEHASEIHTKKQWYLWAGVGVGFLVIAIVFWEWFKEAGTYDAKLAFDQSGWVQLIVEKLGKRYRLVFMTLYGLMQPVLPAAIVEPAIPIAKTIAIFRSLGWYGLFPVLLYTLQMALKTLREKQNRLILFSSLFLLSWTVLSSARAGGDQWDNPRYRMIMMVWFALVTGWAIYFNQQSKDKWLLRWYGVDAVFVLGFLAWYLGRYTSWVPYFSLPGLIIFIVVASVLILGLGWVTDCKHARQT